MFLGIGLGIMVTLGIIALSTPNFQSKDKVLTIIAIIAFFGGIGLTVFESLK